MRLLPIALLCALSIFSIEAIAQGNLLVTPVRIVFEGKKQTQEIILVNTGKDTSTYVVSFVQNRAKEDGTYESIEKPDTGQYFADKYLRFFPRRFTLAPNEPQTMRMQFRRSTDMIDGEYRSHLYFRSDPIKDPLGMKPLITPGKSDFSINLIPIYGITIPAIIRNGNVTVKITISDISLKMKNDTLPVLNFTLNREGNISVYGNIIVTYTDLQNKSHLLKEMNGISVFTPNRLRKFALELNNPEKTDFKSGKIMIRYSSANDAKPEVYASKEFTLSL